MAYRQFLIVGAGDFGRECASWAKADAALTSVPFAGFLSDNPDALKDHAHYSRGIIGAVATHQPDPETAYIMAISNPSSKLAVADRFESLGARFHTMLHPTVTIADHATIGHGVVICPHALVSCDAKIGDFVSINVGSTIGHDVRVGRGATLSAHVDLTGHVQVDEGAFFGSHAVVLPRGRVGAYAIVGAGSVVLRSVRPRVSVMGVPAKQVSPS